MMEQYSEQEEGWERVSEVRQGGFGVSVRGEPNHLLREARLGKEWTQDQLAEEVGTDGPSVSRWERGLVIPGRSYQKELCRVLGKTPQDLGFVSGRKQGAYVTMPRREFLLSVGGSAVAGAAVSASLGTLVDVVVRPVVEAVERSLSQIVQGDSQGSHGTDPSRSDVVTSPTAGKIVRSWPHLAFDLHNERNDARRVRVAQWMLKARNYDLGPSGVDGVFGSYTLAAVQAFQENKGIGVTGKIDDRTWEVLILPSWKLQRGSQVVALHERLYGKIISSFLAAEPDDTFSDQTEKAVRAFQAKYQSRLVVNGEADLDTWCALLERTLL